MLLGPYVFDGSLRTIVPDTFPFHQIAQGYDTISQTQLLFSLSPLKLAKKMKGWSNCEEDEGKNAKKGKNTVKTEEKKKNKEKY